MKETLLDIPAIQSYIHNKHQTFLKDYGSNSEKVMADHQLFADIIGARIYRLALIYKEEKVIDDVVLSEKGPIKNLQLTKKGNPTSINIETNGIVVIIRGISYDMTFDHDFLWPKRKYFEVNNSDFDWAKFSEELLDYIHVTIYGRKEAIESRISGIFQTIPQDKKIKK